MNTEDYFMRFKEYGRDGKEIASGILCPISYFRENFRYSGYTKEKIEKHTFHKARFTDRNNQYDDICVGMDNYQNFKMMINFYCRFAGYDEPFKDNFTESKSTEVNK